MRTAQWNRLEAAVQKSGIARRFKNAPVIAVLSGPSIVIEAIVYKAAKNSGVPMDWGFIGGRAFIHAIGNAGELQKAEMEIRLVWPHNLQNPAPIS